METKIEGNIKVWKEDFAIVKSKQADENSFAIIKDRNEITNVIDQTKVGENNIIEANKDWKLLTFDMVLPFEVVGFLAKISRTLADKGISIYFISSYTTDHILVKKYNLAKAKKLLGGLGFRVK